MPQNDEEYADYQLRRQRVRRELYPEERIWFQEYKTWARKCVAPLAHRIINRLEAGPRFNDDLAVIRKMEERITSPVHLPVEKVIVLLFDALMDCMATDWWYAHEKDWGESPEKSGQSDSSGV